MREPTRNERAADAFDADLFRMIDRATALSNVPMARGHDRAAWRQIAQDLAAVRPLVRTMMAARDLKATR